MISLSPASIRILRALGIYHYLTKPQMLELGLARSVASLDNHAIKPLVPKVGAKSSEKLCDRLTYGLRDTDERPGKNHFLYYLTEVGLDRLCWEFADELESSVGDLREDTLWVPAPQESLSNDFHHRRHYVSLHIALRKWAAEVGATIDFWTHYYQSYHSKPVARGRPPSINRLIWDKTTKKTCTPDGILGITYRGQSRIYLVELHHKTPTAQIVDQLYRNFRAAQAVKAKFPDYPLTHDPYVLSVFTNPEDMKAVQERIKCEQAFDAVRQGLHMTTLDQVAARGLNW